MATPHKQPRFRTWRPPPGIQFRIEEVVDPLAEAAQAFLDGDWSECLAAARKAVRLMPADLYARELLGTSLVRLGRVRAGLRFMDQILRRSLGRTSTRVQFGWAALGTGAFREAHPIFVAEVAESPDVLALMGLAWAAGELGYVAEAVDALRRTLALEPDNDEAHYHLARHLKAKGDRDGAERHVRAAVRIDPGVAAYHHLLGGLELQAERWQSAITALSESIRLDPSQCWPHLRLGIAFRNSDLHEEALEQLKLASEIDPENPRVWLEFGHLADETGERFDALGHYRHTAALAPDEEDAWYWVGDQAQQLGLISEARDALQHLLRAFPETEWRPDATRLLARMEP